MSHSACRQSFCTWYMLCEHSGSVPPATRSIEAPQACFAWHEEKSRGGADPRPEVETGEGRTCTA